MNNIKSTIGILCGNDSQGGSILIAIIAGMVLMGVLTAGVISFTSTDYIQGVNTKQGDSAYYLAESGLRYAASQYKKTENEGANFDPDDVTADDEKAYFLENNLDNQTLTVPDNKGTIDIGVYPYWFVLADRNGTVNLKLPGQVPENFAMPTTGWLRLGNDLDDKINKHYTGGSVDASGVFTCSELSEIMDKLNEGHANDIYPILKANSNQTVTIDLPLSCTTPGIFPSRNGRVLIDEDYYTYGKTEFDSDTNVLTLKNLSSPVTVSAGDVVVLKKFIVLKSQGSVGSGGSSNSKLITYSIPIGDSQEEAAPLDIKLDKVSDFNKYFDKPNNETVKVQRLQTAGGGSAIFTNMKALSQRSDAGEDNDYSQGSFTFKEGLLEDRWEKEHILDYDLQVKLSSYNTLYYAGSGLEFRKKHIKKVNSVNLYQGFGISYLKFNSPALTFTAGRREIKDGDTIKYWGNPWNGSKCKGDREVLATAEVDGDPVLTSGSWLANDAVGTVMLKNSSLQVLDDECYTQAVKIRNNALENCADVDQVLHYEEGFDDYIPDSIKPPGMGSWVSSNYYQNATTIKSSLSWNDTNNEGDKIVLVLWQQKVEGDVEKRRVLAYKDMTHDIYIKGEQDKWDGRLVNDETCLLVRIREDYIDTTKINKINIFYGDSSRKVNYTSRTKNRYKYDILNDRMAYWGGFKLPDQSEPSDGWSALWPPRNLVYWISSFDQFDYFSHIEKPDSSDIPSGASITDPNKFTWDYIASTTGTIDSWDGGGTAVFTFDDDGTLTISDFTTPDSGTYDECEIALGAFFNSDGGQVVGFSDFSIRVLDPGYAYGAFISSVQN